MHRQPLENQYLYLQNFFYHSVDGIVVTDSDGNIELFNPAAQKLLGYSTADVEGKNISILVDTDYSNDETWGESSLSAADTYSVNKAVSALHQLGYSVHLSLSLSEVKTGESTKRVYVLNDMTEQYHLTVMIEAVNDSQIRISRKENPRFVYDSLLEKFLFLTDSKQGFIAKVVHGEEGKKHLQTYSITNIAWNEKTKTFYSENVAQGFIFENLNNLFGAAVNEEKLIISNTPSTDSRAGGLPEGHPALTSFMGIPVFAEKN